MKFDRIIIGGGIAGLLAAHSSQQQGEKVLLLEADTAVGGALSPIEIDGVVVDGGAEAFSVVSPEFLLLLEEIGLESDIEFPRTTEAHIVSRSAKYPIPTGVMGVPTTLEGLEKSGAISSKGVAIARERDARPVSKSWSTWSAAELIRDRLGEEFLTRLVGPLLLGVHSSSAEKLPAIAVYRELMLRAQETGSLISAAQELRGSGPAMGQAVCTVKGGLHRVPRFIHDALRREGATILTGAPVEGLREKRDGFDVVTTSAVFSSTHITLATGPTATKNLLRGLPALGEVMTPFESIASTLVTLSIESAALTDAPLGSGALIARDMELEAKATTHLSAKWGWLQESLPPDRHVVRFSFGRDGVMLPGTLAEHAAEALEAIYGITPSSIRASVTTHWGDTLVALSEDHPALAERAHQVLGAAGISLASGYLSGNGVLGIARSRAHHRERELHGHRL